MSYPVLCTADFGEHNDGLTVHGKLFDATGAQTGSTVTSGIVEVLDGLYIYTLSAPDGHVGVFVMYDSANTALRRTVVVAPRETENSDVKSSTLATPANVTSAQTAILAAIAEIPDAAALVVAIMANPIATDKTFQQTLINIWSTTVGDSEADDANDPTSIVYKDPDGNANVTHTLTDTTRTNA